MLRITRPRVLALAGIVALVGTTAACSSTPTASPSSSAAGLPATIALSAVQDLSGTAGPGGISTQQGQQLAIKEINDTKFLGKTKLTLTFADSAGDPTKGANAMSQAAATGSPIVFGSFSSTSALAEAPIAQRSGAPTIFTQAGSDGVLAAGDYIYRATPLQTSYFHLTQSYLKSKKVKTASVIYDTDVPTIVNLYNLFTSDASKYGYKVVDPQATTSSTTDLSSQITKMLADKPDAIFVDALLAHNIQVIKQLRGSGYTGLIVAQQGAAGGVLAPIGDAAEGVVLATDFSALSTVPSTANFVKLYKAEYNKVPGNFSAEGYDAVWIAARALKTAGTVDRASVLKALQKVTAGTQAGALGKLTFTDRQEVTGGVLVQVHAGGSETTVK